MDRFEEARKAKGKDYQPRTKHFQSDGRPAYTNRLFLESSPYLLQHAHNPVDWYPWGDEAFDTAAKLNRPVLVSIGYSTCHWCHVMEEESFEDKEIAQYLNGNFIAVKVDREERPDVDAVYMSAVQAMTGRGGWPLNVWLTPDRKPFFGATYIPARDGDRGAATGFLTILKKIKEVFDLHQDQVTRSGRAYTEAVEKMLIPAKGDRLPGREKIDQAVRFYKDGYDTVYGGLKGAPKFPSSLPVRFLFRYFRRTGDRVVLDMAANTLEKMAAGGMYDHVGGGFHRYSTDEKWLVPHFEKMLYDNALLTVAYLEGFQVTGNIALKDTAQSILNYVSNEMTSPEGGFYAATDADSPTPDGRREEGYFFTWTPEELKTVLDEEAFGVIKDYYALGPEPDFEGRWILHTPRSDQRAASGLNMSEPRLKEIVRRSDALLYRERMKRPRPLRDEKIITAWNGLMISAYARAGRVCRNPDYLARAARAADFVLTRLVIDNRLYRSYQEEKALHKAFLDDYAFFIAALLDLYEATHDIKWLDAALTQEAFLETYYEDKINGGFFKTGTDQEHLIAKEKPGYDGAEPSGNSVAAMNLMRLYGLTTKEEFYDRAKKTLTAFLGHGQSTAYALSEMLSALDFFLDRPKEIIIVTPGPDKETAEPFLEWMRSHFAPNAVFVLVSEGKEQEILSTKIPAVKDKPTLNGQATAYVCESGVCRLPVTDVSGFEKAISRIEPYA